MQQQPLTAPYPCGLRITLDQEQLEELAIDLPEAGTTVHIEAYAVVTRASTEDPDADGDVDFVSVELQLTELGVDEIAEPEKAGAARERKAASLYGTKGAKVGERPAGGTPRTGEFGAFTRRVGD